MSKIADIASDRIKKYEVLQGSIEVDGVTYGVGDVFYANKIYLYTTNGKHKYKFYGDSIITEFGSDVYIHGEDTPEMRDAKWKAELARREEEYQKQLEPLKKEWYWFGTKHSFDDEGLATQLLNANVPHCIMNGKLVFYRYNACINPNAHRKIMENIGCVVNIPLEIQPSVRYLKYYPPCEVGYEWSNYHHFIPDKEDEFDDVWVNDLSNLQTKETKIACVTKSGLVLLFQRLRGKLYQYTLPPDYVLTLLNNK